MYSPLLDLSTTVQITGTLLADLIDAYEQLMFKVLEAKYKDVADEPTIRNYHSKLTEWLRSTDFYKAPASTVYHDAFVGGLLVHTLNVYNNIVALQVVPQFKDVDIASAALVALTHDWCKIGLYEIYQKNVKNETTGQWEKVDAFRHNQTGVPLGHGVSSMFLASKFFRLTTEEALAIRWHQGRFNVCREEINEFQRANEIYPLVHMIQFADSLSITQYANKTISTN